MQTSSSDRVARAKGSIAMSPVGRAKWQNVLRDRRIGTVKQLLSRVRDISGEPVARKALKGEKLDRQTWESIFGGLKLNRANFFSDVEWYDRDLKTQWGMLWDLAEDGCDRFGLILPENPQNNGLADGLCEREKFLKTIVSRTSVFLEIPGGMSGHLILVEQDAQDNIVLLSPSPLMANPVLTGAVQRLPQYPPSPFQFFQPITIGTNNLWAGIFPSLPDWRWLADAQKRPLRLQLEHLTELFEYANKQPKGTKIFRSSYVVTAA
jgi:hypothetical protein